ncbi:MAG: hypothetical protein M3303_07165, partial [Gemmatimonadota bacterium]|nr:hypothetical protein [Gemmatimonadota bacterium]
MTDWRAFVARRYRTFHRTTLGQGFVGALSGPAIVIPLLLALDAPAPVAAVVATLPVLGSTGQLLVPRLLRATDGNLRGLVLLAAALGETRGFLLLIVTGLAAAGVIPSGVAVPLIAVVVGLAATLAGVHYSVLQVWYQVILPEPERRLLAPRLHGIALGIGAVLLLPTALVIDLFDRYIGLWVFAVPFGVSAVASVVVLVSLRRLPRPGRVHVPPVAEAPVPDPARLARFRQVSALGALGVGLAPYFSIYSMVILGQSAGFAVLLSGVASASAVLTSTAASSLLHHGSASRLQRSAYAVRAGTMAAALLAFPGNPVAPALVIVLVAVLAAGDIAGQLSGTERFFRLTSGSSAIAHQGRYV